MQNLHWEPCVFIPRACKQVHGRGVGCSALWPLRTGLCWGGEALPLMVGQKFLSSGTHMKATCKSTSSELFLILSRGLLGEARRLERKGVGGVPLGARNKRKILRYQQDNLPSSKELQVRGLQLGDVVQRTLKAPHNQNYLSAAAGTEAGWRACQLSCFSSSSLFALLCSSPGGARSHSWEGVRRVLRAGDLSPFTFR